MSANVEISDTFGQWRVKNNEWLSMTNSAGSSEFIKLTNTTNSTSNTTGSIITAGGLGATASAVVGGDVTIFGDVDVDGVFDFDTFTPDGAVQLDNTLTVGVDGTGYDVKLFGATVDAFMLWDEDEDDLVLSGVAALSIDTTTDSSNTTTGSFHTDGGVGIAKKLYVGTDLDVDGTTNLDAVDIDGAVQIDATFSVGVDDTSANVKFFGATSGAYMLWQEDADDFVLAGVAALSIDNTTDSSSITTGSFHTDGGAGIAKKLYVGTDLDVNGTTNLDAVDIDGAVQLDATFAVGVNGTSADVKFFGDTSGSYWLWDASADGVVTVGDLQQTGTITVGVNGTGHDVKFFGAAASAFMLWDQSEDDLVLSGAAALSIDGTTDASSTTTGTFHTDGGAGIAKKLYVGTDLDVNGTTNLDIVDIDSTTQIDNTLSVGVNGTSADVKFFGDTSGSYWLWDASADGIVQVGASQLTGALTVGVDDTGHDVTFFGAAAGALMQWDQAADSLLVRGASADAAGSSGRILLQTAQTDVRDGDIVGRIDFQAPAETGADALLVTASIVAEADATFSASVNSTDLVFLTGDDGAATEKLRIDSTGQATFADGAIDVNIASHDGSNGLKLGGTLVTATAADLNDVVNQATLGKCIAMVNIFG